MILFIDTHAELITIALKHNDDLFIKTKESEFSHSIYTMPMIESIFKENNLDVKDLKKIIVVNGPGSFTGIRIGLSIAKTMAYALNIDINTISSLTAYLISNPGKIRKSVIKLFKDKIRKNNIVVLLEKILPGRNDKNEYDILERYFQKWKLNLKKLWEL